MNVEADEGRVRGDIARCARQGLARRVLGSDGSNAGDADHRGCGGLNQVMELALSCNYLPLNFLRLALAAALRAAALGRGAVALRDLRPIGSKGWGPEWLAGAVFARAAAQRWRALVDEVRRVCARPSLAGEKEEKSRELSRVERQAARLLAELSRTVDLYCDSRPSSDTTTSVLIA